MNDSTSGQGLARVLAKWAAMSSYVSLTARRLRSIRESSRSLSLRALRSPPPDEASSVISDGEDGQFQAQLLVSYEPSPGTIFFVGYTRQEEGSRTYSLSRMQPVSDRFFIKASYLTRF